MSKFTEKVSDFAFDVYDALLDVWDGTVDLFLAQAFNFWVWLGKRLQVEFRVDVPVITRDRPETVQTLVDLTNANAELKAQRDAARIEIKWLREQGLKPDKGENRPNRKKLTRTEVGLIRDMHRSGTRNVDIAEAFDVNPATISRIVRGQYYGKVSA